MKSKIEEIALLASKKGFEAKTLSTKWTLNAHLGISKSKTFLVNETCDYLLLAEMQKWLREKHKIYSEIHSIEYTDINRMRFQSNVFSELYSEEWNDDINEEDVFDTYELAVIDSLKEAFKLIK